MASVENVLSNKYYYQLVHGSRKLPSIH